MTCSTLIVIGCLKHLAGGYFPDFCVSAAANLRSFAIVAAEGSFLFPLLFRRLVLVT